MLRKSFFLLILFVISICNIYGQEEEKETFISSIRLSNLFLEKGYLRKKETSVSGAVYYYNSNFGFIAQGKRSTQDDPFGFLDLDLNTHAGSDENYILIGIGVRHYNQLAQFGEEPVQFYQTYRIPIELSFLKKQFFLRAENFSEGNFYQIGVSPFFEVGNWLINASYQLNGEDLKENTEVLHTHEAGLRIVPVFETLAIEIDLRYSTPVNSTSKEKIEKINDEQALAEVFEASFSIVF